MHIQLFAQIGTTTYNFSTQTNSTYDREYLRSIFTSLIINTINRSQNPIGWINVRTTLKHYSAFIKNPCFQDERETRIIYYPNEQHKLDGIVEMSNIVSTPNKHYELPWIKSNGLCALKEIIIGTNCMKTEADIQDLLHENNIYNDISIVKSEYPYKISHNRGQA